MPFSYSFRPPSFLSSVLLIVLFLFSFVLIWALVLLILVLRRWRKTQRIGSLHPLIGPLIVQWNLHHLHDFVAFYLKKDKFIRVEYPGYDYYLIADPANVEHMLKTNFQNYTKGKFVHEKQEEFLGNGIFSVDGKEWKHQRKVASYQFGSKSLRDFCELEFRKQAIKLTCFLTHEAQICRPADLQDLILRMTFDTYCEIGFGLEMNTLQQDPLPEHLMFAKAFDDCNAHVFLRFVDPLWKLKRWLRVGGEAKFVRDVATLDRILFRLIEKKRRGARDRVTDSSIAQSDLLSRFMALGESDPEEYSDKKLRDIVLNFMIAARDTTAITLCWLFYCLHKNPRVQEKLLEEIHQVTSQSCGAEGADSAGSDGGLPSKEQVERFAELLTYDKLNKMHYLHACLLETLRLYPAVPHEVRGAVAADTFPDGTKVKAGDLVNVSVYAMGRMKWLWGEDAKDFRPERFIKDGVCQQESPFKLLAFLGGPRMCLGKDFAFLQMKVTVALLLRFFMFEIVQGHRVRYRIMLTLHMTASGLKVNVLPRLRKQLLEAGTQEQPWCNSM